MNRKHPLFKEWLRVKNELHELENIQANQNWIELDKPYKDGYYKFFDLRDDIKNRDDAWVFYECIRISGQKCWSRDKSFKKKIRKGKYEYISPFFVEISENKYESLHPVVKKYFSLIRPWDRRWNPFYKKYECNVPRYYFVEKVKPRWVTHYKEHDSVIQRKIDEKVDYLKSAKFYGVGNWNSWSSAPKSFTKSYNKSDRRYNKQVLHKNLYFGGDQFDKYDYRYNHRHSANWDYW